MKYFLISCLALSFLWISCQNEQIAEEGVSQRGKQTSELRSPQEAVAIAQEAIKILEGRESRGCRSTIRQVDLTTGVEEVRPMHTRSMSAQPAMYAVNFKDNAGYVLVAATRSESPLLAITEEGHYTASLGSGNRTIDYMVKKYSENPRRDSIIKMYARFWLSNNDDIKGESLDLYYFDYPEGQYVCPRSAKWGQGSPLGDLASNKVAGCVTTALAIAFHHYKYPQVVVSLQESSLGKPYSINWERMTEQGMLADDSVTLRNLGEDIRTFGFADTTDSTQTSIFISDIPKLLDHFGYKYVREKYCSQQALNYLDFFKHGDLFVAESQTTDHSGGHLWVIDGLYYEADRGVIHKNGELIPWVFGVKTYLHCNWGWSGENNGFFNEDFLCTSRPLKFDTATGNKRNHCFSTSDLKLYRLYPKK